MFCGRLTAHISLMHLVILDEKKWVTDHDYLRALSFCLLLPGPEARQLVTRLGWRMGRQRAS